MRAGGRPVAGPDARTHASPNAPTDANSPAASDHDNGFWVGDLLGFVSGYNAFIADGASIPPDSAGTIGWVDHYGCPHGPDLPLQNGDVTIAQVGIALVEFTRQRTNYPRLWPPLPPVQYVP